MLNGLSGLVYELLCVVMALVGGSSDSVLGNIM